MMAFQLRVFVQIVQLHLFVPCARSMSASNFTAPQWQLPRYVFNMAHPSGFDQIRIEHAVDELPVLRDTVALHGLAHKSDFLEHAHRGGIPLEHRRLEPCEARILLQVFEHGACRGGHDASSPKWFTRPVPETRGSHEDALARAGADATDGRTFEFDGKIDAARRAVDEAQPLVGVIVGVRMRKDVREIAPDTM